MLLAPLTAALGLVGPCAATPAYPAPWPQRPRYALDLRIDRGFGTVRGRLDVRFTPNVRTTRLVFRLWPNGPRFRGSGTALATGRPTSRGAPLRFVRPNATTLVVFPRRPLARGTTISVRVPFTLRVGGNVQERISRWDGGLRLGSFFPILAWDPRSGWATEPPPRIPGEASTSPVADFDVRVRTARGVVVGATGVQTGPGRWRARAVRDFALAAGGFRVAEAIVHAPSPVRVRALVAPPNAANVRVFLQLAEASLTALSRRYGPYPWPAYTVVVPPDLGAVGIEYPTLVYSGDAPRLRETIVQHETGHQWFYSLVGNDQARDPWLDETLATWAQTRVAGQTVGRVDLPELARTHVGASLAYWGLRAPLYFAAAYAAGAVALASLGPADDVDCALRHYAARGAYGIARPGDLIAELERVIPGSAARLRTFGIHP